MHALARILLAIALIEFVLSLGMFELLWLPRSLYLTLALCVAVLLKRPASPYWAHGTARWCSENELRDAGMIGGQRGLAIGRLAVSDKVSLRTRLRTLTDSRISARKACENTLCWAFPFVFKARGEVVKLSNAVHTAVFGPTGAREP